MFTNKVNFALLSLIIILLSVFSQIVSADSVSYKDRKFMKNAAHAGYYEIEGSQLALNKSRNAEVKKFAKHIVDDHTKAAGELKALALKKGVDIPTKPSILQAASIKLLNINKDTEFDKDYAESIGVDAHQSAVEEFTEAAEDADDAEVKAFAAKTLPALKQHLEMAQALEKHTKKLD